MSDERKMLYRGYAQIEGITISADTIADLPPSEARRSLEEAIARPTSKYERVVVLPIGKKESFDQGHILFCPRCGKPIEYVERSEAHVDCHECNASFYAEIEVPPVENEDEDE